MTMLLNPLNLLTVSVYKLPHGPETLPMYATSGSAGMDLAAAVDQPITLEPMARILVPTGLVIALPEGYECQIRPRSGLSIKHGVTLINAVGTIDSDYREEVKVPLVNLSQTAYTIHPGDRIAQMIIAPVTQITWSEVATARELPGPTGAMGRNGGFGSTGR